MAVWIKTGAIAYSMPGGINWGNVPSSLIGPEVTLGNRSMGYSQIVVPLWPKNQKPFWVKDAFLEVFTTDPPPPILSTYIEPIIVWINGVKYRTVGDRVPLERVE